MPDPEEGKGVGQALPGGRRLPGCLLWVELCPSRPLQEKLC